MAVDAAGVPAGGAAPGGELAAAVRLSSLPGVSLVATIGSNSSLPEVPSGPAVACTCSSMAWRPLPCRIHELFLWVTNSANVGIGTAG